MTSISRRRSRSAQYPLASIAPYGPDTTFATKLVVSVLERFGQREPSTMRTWTTHAVDVRHDPTIAAGVADFLREYGVKHTVTSDRIMGCPHQEGIDYPMGRNCPRCPFWANMDRFTHEPRKVPTPTLSPSEILTTLSREASVPPAEALASAEAHREALIQPLLSALQRGIANPSTASIQERNLFSFALYFLWLAEEGLEREPSQVWDSLVAESADIEALVVFPALRRAYRDGLADPQSMTPEELAEVESSPSWTNARRIASASAAHR